MATITGINIEEGMVIDFNGTLTEIDGVNIPVHVATVDYYEVPDGLGEEGAHVVPDFLEGTGKSVYVSIIGSMQYRLLG